MALADILEALTAGGSAGLSAYAREKELEQERAERERARQEEARYRQQMLDASLRAEERAEAAAEYQRNQDTERGLIEGRLREVRDIYNPAAVRQSVAGLEQEIGGVGEAPGQTYAARMMRQQEERPKSPLASALREEEPEVALEGMGRVSEELPSRLSFLSEVPEFEATESFRERGSQQYGDTAVRPVTPEERAASTREREEAVARLMEAALGGNQQAQAELVAGGMGDELEQYMDIRRPTAEAPELVRTEGGYMAFDPETGGYIPAVSATGERMIPPQGTPAAGPAPQRAVDDEGYIILVDPVSFTSRRVRDEEGNFVKADRNKGLQELILQSIAGGGLDPFRGLEGRFDLEGGGPR